MKIMGCPKESNYASLAVCHTLPLEESTCILLTNRPSCCCCYSFCFGDFWWSFVAWPTFSLLVRFLICLRVAFCFGPFFRSLSLVTVVVLLWLSLLWLPWLLSSVAVICGHRHHHIVRCSCVVRINLAVGAGENL